MANTDELRYIQAFSRIIGVKEDDAIEYAQKKGLNALVDNATQLLTTPAQREKHQAFLDLYRMSSGINARNPIINSPESASDFFHSVMDKIYDKEAFVVAFLNTKNRVIDHEVVSVGTINSSIVHPREVFRNAIINKANSVILCHNHPSGDLTPSAEDISITERLKETGNLLGIRVLDHLIINGINMSEIYSFKTHGVLETPKTYNTAKSVLNEETDSGQPDKLARACERLGGVNLAHADVGYRINSFDCLPIKFLFWDGDDEFPAQGNLLFDASATDFIHVESTVSLAIEGIQRLAEAAELEIKGPLFQM